MAVIEVQGWQTIVDISAMHLGDASRFFEICEINGINPSDELLPGTSLTIPAVAVESKKKVEAFALSGLFIASNTEQTELDPFDWDVYYGLYD